MKQRFLLIGFIVALIIATSMIVDAQSQTNFTTLSFAGNQNKPLGPLSHSGTQFLWEINITLPTIITAGENFDLNLTMELFGMTAEVEYVEVDRSTFYIGEWYPYVLDYADQYALNPTRPEKYIEFYDVYCSEPSITFWNFTEDSSPAKLSMTVSHN
ncbi:MAG: hypothetical protein E3J86_14095 [Candidatus Thorarchaeota archaeon]|nr:MAG: hypothetical protein E3J86_14095 [Candidatus Thorarchaeota archaeon]